MKYYSKNGKRLNGWQDASARLQHEISRIYQRTNCCSFMEIRIYVPRFLMTFQAGINMREFLYGNKIVIEAVMDDFDAQFVILLTHYTDFTNPVSDNKDFLCEPEYSLWRPAYAYHRTHNLFLSVSQAHLFVSGILPYLHSRTLNLITTSDGSAKSIIQSFGQRSFPYAAFSRCFLASI